MLDRTRPRGIVAGLPRYLRCKGYTHIATLSWGDDHHVNPTWLPEYLDALATALKNDLQPSIMDVLGLSRGHQALLYACGQTPQLAKHFRPPSTFMAAGGCIWQQSDAMSEQLRNGEAVLARISEMDKERGAPMFSFIMLSRAHATTKWSGDIARKDGKTKSVYRNHHEQSIHRVAGVADHGQALCRELRVLNTADPGRTLCRALHLAAELQRTGRLPPPIPDVTPTELLSALCAGASASGPPIALPAQRPSGGASPPYLFRQDNPTSTKCLADLPIPDWDRTSAMPDSRVTYVSGPPGSGKTSVAPLQLLGLLEHLRQYPAAIVNSGFRRPSLKQPLAD